MDGSSLYDLTATLYNLTEYHNNSQATSSWYTYYTGLPTEGPNKPTTPTWEVLYGAIALLCCFVGTFGNLVVLRIFWDQRRDLVTMIYINIVIIDISISMSMLLMGLSYLNNREPGLFGNAIVCNIWGVMWNINSRMSVFCVAILSITRTTSLLWPFSMTRRRQIIIPIIMYFVLQVTQSSIPYWYGRIYIYSQRLVMCSWRVMDVFPLKSTGFTLFYFGCMLLEVAFPVLPVLCSCFISVYILRTSGAFIKNNTTLNARRRYATVTIILITLIYVTFNLPLCVYFIIGTLDTYSSTTILQFDYKTFYLGNFLEKISVALNAAINPILYFYRIKVFRKKSQMFAQTVRRSMVNVFNTAEEKVECYEMGQTRDMRSLEMRLSACTPENMYQTVGMNDVEENGNKAGKRLQKKVMLKDCRTTAKSIGTRYSSVM